MTKKLLIIIIILQTVKLSGQSWTNVGSGLNLLFFQAYDFQKHNSKLFAATRTGSHIWDGSNWTYIYSGIDWTLNLAEFNDTVYISGDFYFSNTNIARVLKFDGTNWNPAGGKFNQSNPNFCSVKSTIVHNNKLYAGGQFQDNEGIPMKNIACYNGIKWDTVGKGLNGLVCNLSTHNGSVIAAGSFISSGTNNSVRYIASWNGLNWNPISPSYTFKAPSCGPSYSFNNKLIIGNIWDTINKIPMLGIAAFDGVNFYSMSNNTITNVSSFWTFNNQLFMSGSTFSVNNVVLKWNGTTWEQVGGIFDDSVFTLEDFNGELFAGGRFSNCSGSIATGAARTNIPVSIREYSYLNNLKYFPNPTHDHLTISCDNSISINISNLFGQSLKSFNVPIGTNNVDISSLSTGIYFIQFTDGASTKIEKLIVD